MAAPDPASRRRTLARAGAVLGFWTLVGLASAVQATVMGRLAGRPETLSGELLGSLPGWLFWAAATPAIVLLGRRWRFDRGHRVRPALLHGAASLVAVLLHAGWVLGILAALGGMNQVDETPGQIFRLLVFSRLYLDVLIYGAILGVSYAFEYHGRYRERELKASRLETALARARLDALRMQLNPHFLFNALNAVSAQARAGRSAAAVTMLGGLGDLLRYALDTGEERLVPLWREIAFLDRYLDIERVRFADRLAVEVDVPAEVREARVPPLLLQPLVENAVRHGIAPREGPGRIEVLARREDGRLVLVVRDDGVGMDGEGEGRETSTSRSAGVGLANARARLAALWGDAARLTVARRAEGGVEAVIEMPWTEGAP